MAAKNKLELLSITLKEHEKLTALLKRVDPKLAEVKDEEDTSIKDVIGHRAHWIVLFLGWYRDGLAGKTVYFPAEGYKWNDLKRYNAQLRASQSGMGWQAALDALQQSHAALVEFIESHSDAALYGGPMQGANNQWTPGRWAEAAGPSHYRSASKYIRARLRAVA